MIKLQVFAKTGPEGEIIDVDVQGDAPGMLDQSIAAMNLGVEILKARKEKRDKIAADYANRAKPEPEIDQGEAGGPAPEPQEGVVSGEIALNAETGLAEDPLVFNGPDVVKGEGMTLEKWVHDEAPKDRTPITKTPKVFGGEGAPLETLIHDEAPKTSAPKPADGTEDITEG